MDRKRCCENESWQDYHWDKINKIPTAKFEVWGDSQSFLCKKSKDYDTFKCQKEIEPTICKWKSFEKHKHKYQQALDSAGYKHKIVYVEYTNKESNKPKRKRGGHKKTDNSLKLG